MFLCKIFTSYCFYSDFFFQMLTFKSVCMLTNQFRRKRDSFWICLETTLHILPCKQSSIHILNIFFLIWNTLSLWLLLIYWLIFILILFWKQDFYFKFITRKRKIFITLEKHIHNPVILNFFPLWRNHLSQPCCHVSLPFFNEEELFVLSTVLSQVRVTVLSQVWCLSTLQA